MSSGLSSLFHKCRQHGKWMSKFSTGIRPPIILGFFVFLSSIHTIRSTHPDNLPEIESRSLKVGLVNFDHGPLDSSYMNRMNLAFNHLSDLRRPPLPRNTYHKKNDLSVSAQTLYDLRGFHIPLGGQAETQRFLRQQNHLQQPDHQTTPLVFPSFFQPQQQQRYEAQPQPINIFGHNQHHQQTHRFRIPDAENSFRPSQPDLGVTTTTENVFRPVHPAGVQLVSTERKLANENPVADDEEIYVYDDGDYQLDQERSLDKDQPQVNPASISIGRINTVETSTEAPVLLDQNEPKSKHALKGPQINHFSVYETPIGNDINSPPSTRPNVEIIPSSERRPPDQLDSSSPIGKSNPDEGSRVEPPSPKSSSRRNNFPRINTRLPLPNFAPPQPFPTLNESPRVLLGEKQSSPQVHSNEFQRIRTQDQLVGRIRQRPEKSFPEVILNSDDRIVDRNPPILPQRLNPYHQNVFQSLPPFRPAGPTLNPEVLTSSEELVETQKPTLPPTSTTTEIQTTPELKSIRQFPIRNRGPVTTSTTTTSLPKRRIIRPRIRPNTDLTTTTTPIEEIIQIDYDVPTEISTPRFIPTEETPKTRSKVPPLIRSRTASKPKNFSSFVPQLSEQPENQYDQNPPEEHTNQDTYEYRNSPNLGFPAQKSQNNFDQPIQKINENFAPEFIVQQHGRPQQQLRFNNHPRFQQPPSEVPSGKPLYISGKMLGKEGGLYAGHVIPPGYSYGSIPFLPINQVFERMPNILDSRSIPSQPKLRVPTSAIRHKQNNPRISVQHKTLTSTGREDDRKAAVTVSKVPTETKNIRSQIRRKLRPENIRISAETTRTTETPLSSNTVTESEVRLTTNEVSEPTRIIIPRRRPKRPRVLSEEKSEVVTRDEQVVSRATTKSSKIRPRIRPRQKKPTTVAPLGESKSFGSETTQLSTQSSVQISRKPTEAPGRFSSRYRIESTITTPNPTLPTLSDDDPQVQKVLIRHRPHVIKVPKNFKIDPITATPPPTFSTSSTKPKTTTRAKPKGLAEEDGLPPSIYLSPKDVLTNRKPARRIPPGSYSDRIKALQARRKNFKLRANPNHDRTTGAQRNISEEDEDEIFSSQGSANEQVQNKREIGRQRHKVTDLTKSGTNHIGISDAEVKPDLVIIANSTEVNSDETMSLLGIMKPTEKSQLDSPKLESLQEEDNEANEPEENAQPNRSSPLRPTINPGNAYAGSIFNNDLKYSSKSPFSLFTMSTEEPSLPLEAYFPIVHH